MRLPTLSHNAGATGGDEYLSLLPLSSQWLDIYNKISAISSFGQPFSISSLTSWGEIASFLTNLSRDGQSSPRSSAKRWCLYSLSCLFRLSQNLDSALIFFSLNVKPRVRRWSFTRSQKTLECSESCHESSNNCRCNQCSGR